MSKYTTTFGNLIDTQYEPLTAVLAAYPIYDESHRSELNQKIIDHFRFSEIGQETAALFTHFFKTTLQEIMPMYNELYKTAALDYPILQDTDYFEETHGTTNSGTETSGTSSGSSHSSRGHSDTPQGSFNFTDVTANSYLSDADVDDGSTSGSSSGTSVSNGKSDVARTVRGKMSNIPYAELVKQYREQIINIDRLILGDLESCFMGVY